MSADRKIGIIKAKGDPGTPEKPDNIARTVARRAAGYFDDEDREIFSVVFARLILIILFGVSLGLALRAFLFFAGFREVFW